MEQHRRCRVILCYCKNPHCSGGRHGGIGISCLNTAKVLMHEGYCCEVWPICGGDDLWSQLHKNGHDVTHVVIAALFIPTGYLAKLAFAFPNIKFVVNSHSNVGFLQAEPEAITKFRETIDLQTESRNVFASGNSERFARAVRIGYGECLLLPNLYYLHGNECSPRVTWQSGTLRIGCFGANRVQKNISTAVVAAVELTRQLKTQSEFWINTGRTDGNGDVVWRAVWAWTKGLPHITVKELPWQEWSQFRKVVDTMHILIQPSYSETFSQVAADACAHGIPTISGDAIDWLPDAWRANTDDATDVAHHARMALLDPHSGEMGLRALKARNAASLHHWRDFLK